MSKSHTESFSEIERHLTDCRGYLEAIEVATSVPELRKTWENFLFSFHRTMGRLISLGISESPSRGWGHQLKNASTRDDEGLVFLREARAAAEHDLKPFAKFAEPMVRIGGNAIVLAGTNRNISFSGCVVNGRPIGNFTMDTKDGKVSRLSGVPMVPILETPAAVQLQPVRNAEKGRTFPVPSQLAGAPLTEHRPIELAKAATAYLVSRRDELRALLA